MAASADKTFLSYICEQVYQSNEKEIVKDVVWKEVELEIRSLIVPEFWSFFKHKSSDLNNQEFESETKYEHFQKFIAAVKGLQFNYQNMVNILLKTQLIQTSDINSEFYLLKLHNYLRGSLLSQIPVYFDKVVKAFYSVSLNVFSKIYSTTGPEVVYDVKCNGCCMEMGFCHCKHLIESINEVNETLIKLDLLDRITGQTMTSLVQLRIKDHILNACQGVFDKSHLKELEVWTHNNIISWLIRIFNKGHLEIDRTNDTIANIIQSFTVKLTFFLYEYFARSLITQFFSIIIDFPDSTPAIDDLKICMEKIDMRKHLIKSIKNSLEKRILHPGVNTKDILTGYVAAIKTIRHLDPSGIILETVTEPIKEYLRKRTDTVRCVVTSLTEEGPTDLSEELAKGEIYKENLGSSINNELKNWETWFPDPFVVEKNNRVNIIRSADIISMVVDIYGSKELFMNEYRNLMADRMLTLLDLNADKEIRNLELLKLRFGDTLLHSCEVMLKDISDSKRINLHIQCDSSYIKEKRFNISSIIISAQFWPSFNKEGLELPSEIENEFKQYTKSYEAYKGNRTLNWRSVTGKVCIEIEIGKRTFEITVSPTQAVIIYHFQYKNKWTLDELSNVMKVPQSVLRRRITFWKAYGLLQEVQQDVFKLIEEEAQKSEIIEIQLANVDNAEDDMESAMASASDQREEELQVFWSYIVGMLTNLDSLPIERIHQMLKLFASNGLGIEFSQDELKDFLQRKVREHKLLFSGGVYQLAK